MKTPKVVADKGKLVTMQTGPHATPTKAQREFASMNLQEGSLGGGVASHELRPGEAKHKGRTHDYYAVVFMVWPSYAPLPDGCGVSSRKEAAKLGVKVPRGVDA